MEILFILKASYKNKKLSSKITGAIHKSTIKFARFYLLTSIEDGF